MDWNKYEVVIGLEVHAQMLTETKTFCGCSNKFGDSPNSNVCPVCLGMPGVLPVLNKKLIEFAIKMGLATNCRIAPYSIFARKNYFYPDLPKGYQISQFEEPICVDGYIEIEKSDGTKKKIGLIRIHMEEDAGKLIHDQDVDTLVDVNRCGTPLLEIVSQPDIRSAEEAYLYLIRIKQIITYLGICDGNMEEGSLRCDANVSLRLCGAAQFGTKVEIKNMNSFRNVERALDVEIERQYAILEHGGTILQETLLYNADTNSVRPMRSKEEANDYRYFPDPDLVPVLIDEPWIEKIKAAQPELPARRRERYMQEFSLPKYDAEILTGDKAIADYYESITTNLRLKSKDAYKQASNYVMTDVLRVVGEEHVGINQFPIEGKNLARMIDLINEGVISTKLAKDVFEEMLKSGQAPDSIVEKKGLRQVSDQAEIDKVVEEVLQSNPEEVQRYIGGKDKVFGFFVGEVMKKTRGKANPKVLNDLLRQKLERLKN
ncbi:MAG TPA: Asp-tRNA(Asn)/Glu-tRNA(Gln) amidotransferase subunit GatB [Candidatus Acidoferrales bacterium]|nr:Asp-tRNA(Asn)/Glu-tRNA(Gln) amidotransferase subunit GatB [Candidatus Acidoferrales bacterium]